MTSVSSDLFQSLSDASRTLYKCVSTVFKKSDTPGRQHYFFSLNSLESALPVSIKRIDALLNVKSVMLDNNINIVFKQCYSVCVHVE